MRKRAGEFLIGVIVGAVGTGWGVGKLLLLQIRPRRRAVRMSKEMLSKLADAAHA